MYLACFDFSKEFHEDWNQMRRGEPVLHRRRPTAHDGRLRRKPPTVMERWVEQTYIAAAQSADQSDQSVGRVCFRELRELRCLETDAQILIRGKP
jgi:hypothetical protein